MPLMFKDQPLSPGQPVQATVHEDDVAAMQAIGWRLPDSPGYLEQGRTEVQGNAGGGEDLTMQQDASGEPQNSEPADAPAMNALESPGPAAGSGQEESAPASAKDAAPPKKQRKPKQ